jgi:peroxiredoxin
LPVSADLRPLLRFYRCALQLPHIACLRREGSWLPLRASHEYALMQSDPSSKASNPPLLSARVVRAAKAALVIVLVLPILASAQTALVGKAAPDFALRSLRGENIRLSEHSGEVVVVNFWATWCGPCRQEMPQLDELYAKYRRAGLVLLGVSLDYQKDRATEMAQTLKVAYPVLFDEQRNVSRSYGVDDLPVTLLIDRQGVVRFVSQGYKPGYESRYAEQLRELLNE